jgi:DNA-binding NarL/FixJ family response regulator
MAHKTVKATMAKARSTTNQSAARVLIVDDHPAVREALGIRISAQPDLVVCGEAADAGEALRLAAATSPNVAIVDIALKSGNGIDLIQRLVDRDDSLRAIVWSVYSDELYAERAIRAGAVGYINKEQATCKIIEAIRQVLDGQLYLSPAITERLVKRTVGRAVPELGRPCVEMLSNRELDVLRLIGNGVKTSEIAKRLYLSVKTVETYRDRIREKLDLGDGTALARYAAQWVLEGRRQ